MPTLPDSTAVSSVLSGALRRLPGLTPSDSATNPDTPAATSMTREHHHSDVAAATSPSTSRGNISRHPALRPPTCSLMMRLSPIQPTITTSAPDVTVHTTVHACRTSSLA